MHWLTQEPLTNNPCFTGYVRPGTTKILYPAYFDRVQYIDLEEDIAEPKDRRGMIVLSGRSGIPWADYFDAPQGPVKVSIVDTNGSTQSCQIKFEPGTRDELIVT